VSGEFHNMSAPPRTSFYSEVQAVTGTFLVFRLQPPQKPLAKNKLNRPIFDCGLEGIPPRDEVETAIRRIPAFLIGVKYTGGAKVHTVTAPALSIAILSRRVGEIYVRSRQPDYSAGHLLNQKPFAVEAWEGSL
jgi:hypothetical protein